VMIGDRWKVFVAIDDYSSAAQLKLVALKL